MKDKVSALMDGEFDSKDISGIMEILKENQDVREEWKTYHLIGDALRQSPYLTMNLSTDISKKLKAEPTILSPNISNQLVKKQKKKLVALSIAASAVVMVSTWLVMNNLKEPQQSMIAAHPNHNNLVAVPVMVAAPPSGHYYSHPPAEINDYLFVHREFSPGVTMQGQVTTVSGTSQYHERHGR